MYILGINAFHGDSSACLIKDGKLLYAIEEERFRRVKHWAGFPSEAIRFCLEEEKISLSDVDYITVSRDPTKHFFKKVKRIILNPAIWPAALDRWKNRKNILALENHFARDFDIDPSLIRRKIKFIEHHRSHLASAFYASPFKEAALISIDGFGDFSSMMSGHGLDNKIIPLQQVFFPHSLGIFYTAMTQFLGFPHYGDEYKVMGLAPYGKPVYTEKLRNIIYETDDGLFRLNLKYFVHHHAGVSMSWDGGSPHIDTLYSEELIELLGPPRKKQDQINEYHRDIAASTQRLTEEIIFHMIQHLHKKIPVDNLCVAGGVAQNSVANGKIRKNTPFKNIYIPSAGHDAGTSVGSAFYYYFQELGNRQREPVWHAYTGAKYTNDEIDQAIRSAGLTSQLITDKDLLPKVAKALADGKVVGWFQGRSEFGPRALGHRSILADPRRKDAKDLLNLKIKRRESFRPFAPSILEEYKDEYFVDADRVPFMEKVYPIIPEKQNEIPAVTHVDGTGRLQTVMKGDRYYQLIEEFYKITGVPVLLNTSFNENEPIVNSPQEAIDCFLRTQMDVLVLENHWIER
ncbi:MAG: hypothetical protein KatS3mg034_1101 [Vicingaceae bacterium]|nr:MAG: hypothetical protein KatS3mg034_1101 [Vicingaceae bacterium]